VDIQVFSDVVCPWCFIGAVRLEKVLGELGVEANVSYRPFMLDPDTPAGGFNVPQMLRRKYGADPKQLWARVEAAARESGLALDLSKQAMSYPTAAAHTLIRHAGPRGTQRALARTLFHSYFIDAADIGSPAVLATVARDHGFSEDDAVALASDPAELAATRALNDEAYGLGIQGAPFYVFNDELAFSGAQPEKVFRQAIEQAAR
jgi:predicted DsbA family dithiol-disulfide isomerase